MAATAKWGPKTFSVSSNKIVPFTGLSTAFALKSDSNNDTSGTPPINTKGRELQTITFETAYFAALGTDPREQIEDWESLIGEVYPLQIGGKKFGPDKLQLTNVAVSGVELTPKGAFISARLCITLTEYQPQEAGISVKKAVGIATAGPSGTDAGASGPGAGPSGTGPGPAGGAKNPGIGSIGGAINKGAAMAAKPSKADKSAKKPNRTENKKKVGR